jgi:exodeoxyribonuclease VII small subunit
MTSPTDETPPDPSELGYEGAIEELEGIIDRIEQGEIGLEASLAELRRGTELHKRCRQILEAAEQELERITAEQRQSAEAEPDEPGEPA